MGDQGRHILIVGLGASGQATARYCLDRPQEYGRITLVDGGDSAHLRNIVAGLQSDEVSVAAHLGAQRVPAVSYDLAVMSPGIAPHTELFQSAVECTENVLSEIEFAYQASQHRWVAITGSNGKTTTTALVTHLLRTGGVPAVAVGNIGQPAIEAVACHASDTIMVAEVSSFQLYSASTFAPDVSAVLNITPDHLDWHESMDDYAEAKAKVFAQQTSGQRMLLFGDDGLYTQTRRKASTTEAEIVSVSLHQSTERPMLTVVDDRLVYCDPDGTCHEYCLSSELQIKGAHNVVNALFAAGIAQYFGIDTAAIREGLVSFSSVAHRLQYIATVQDIDWYNDSKATNPDAVFKAVDALLDQPITLLVGGRNKGNDFTELLKYAQPRVNSIICFGEAGSEIFRTAQRVYGAASLEHVTAPSMHLCTTMAEALDLASGVAQRGGVVLLSPACASFDEFSGYHERGEVFAEYVHRLEDACSDG